MPAGARPALPARAVRSEDLHARVRLGEDLLRPARRRPFTNRSGKLLREIQGGDEPKFPFDRAMGLAYNPRTNALVIIDLENRIVRLPAP